MTLNVVGTLAYKAWYYTSPASCFYVRQFNQAPAVSALGGAGVALATRTSKLLNIAKIGGVTISYLDGVGEAATIYGGYAYALRNYCKKE